ncbi:sigma-54-dependent transcriptional regulator [Bacteroidota bacterium]
MIDGSILIIDDNKGILSTLELLLTDEVKEIITLADPNRIPEFLDKYSIDVILLDMNFNAGINTGNEGIFWLKKILSIEPLITVVMITAYGSFDLAVKAIKIGAADFIVKPWNNHKIIATIHSAYRLNQSKRKINHLNRNNEFLTGEINKDSESFITGPSKSMEYVMTVIRKVANTDANILITGENGVGKEIITREIHRLSNRKNELLVSVDLGTIPETLFESELFGHAKGAFTDAKEYKQGKFELANKGTLFLDEISNLPLALQTKLLTVLQNRIVNPIGSNKQIPIDIRLICASNVDLNSLVKNKLFREDLLFRINTIPVEIPPLRERREDIPGFAMHFLKKYSEKYIKGTMKISGKAIEKLVQYNWPGNIRELQHTIEKAVILSENSILHPADFIFAEISDSLSPDSSMTLIEMEKKMILKALKINSGNISIVAQQLGITRQTLYNKMKKYGI